MGFTKLDSGIVDSSIWDEHSDVMKVFISFWTKSNPEGLVSATKSSIFRSSNLLDLNKNPQPFKYFEKILNILKAPDETSKSKEYGGARIVELEESKWLIVNYKKYREYTYSDNPEAVKKRKQRAKKGTQRDTSKCVQGHSASVYASLYASLSVPEYLYKPLDRFYVMRNIKKKPMSDYAIELLIKKLFKLSKNPKEQILILEQSIFYDWQGIFPLKDDFISERESFENKNSQPEVEI